ncbi:MAG: Bug family tripartite tricarboxylate transporter substrate binding protein, partial [Pseudorhodoplanes sp.]
MRLTKFARWSVGLVAAALSLNASAALAQESNYPTRPVRIIVPYPAGGSNDIAARILAQKLSEQMGQQFIVENRGGGGGNIGMEAVARSDPDGYTLLLTAPGPLAVNHALMKNMPIDPAKAFTPIALIGEVP